MKKALVVGINNYPTAPLRGCIKDATDFSSLIETHGDEAKNFSVQLWTDVPHKNKLLSAIHDLFKDKNETALFYFSGHGAISELGGYLVTPDHRRYDEGISMNDVLTLANNSPSTNKIIILDCCHSGTITAPELTTGNIGHINEGVTILTASRNDEVAMEVNGKGVFTNLLLEALKGGAADINGKITPGSIYAYIDQALGPWEQRPVFKTNVSRFTILRTVAPRLPLADIRKITTFFETPDTLFQLNPSFEFTNDPDMEHVYSEPFANKANTEIFSVLQKMHSAGLVDPVGEDHMYWAAMRMKACSLTPLGEHYWHLAKEKKL